MLRKSWKEKVPVSSHYIEILFVRLFFKKTWCCLLRSANSTYISLVLLQHCIWGLSQITFGKRRRVSAKCNPLQTKGVGVDQCKRLQKIKKNSRKKER